MRRIAALLVALLRDWWRSRETVFFVVLFPIILLVIFSSVFAASAPSFGLAVQNADVDAEGQPTEISGEFVTALEDVDALNVQRLDADRNLTAWSEDGGRRALVIPDGFDERVRAQSGQVRIAIIRDTVARFEAQMNDSDRASIEAGLDRAGANATNATGATVTLYAPPDDQSAPVVRGIVAQVVGRVNERALGIDESPVTLETGTLGEEGLSASDYFLPAFVATLVLINGVMTVPGVVAGFSSDGTLKRLAATPLRRRDWILAHVLQQSLLAVVLTGLMIAVATVLFGVTATPGPLAIALVVVGAVAFSALGMVLGGLLPDPDAATSLGGIVAFPMMFLSGVFWEIDIMPETLQTIGRALPLYQFHVAFRRLTIEGSAEGVPEAFAMLAALAVVFVALATRLTPWRDFDE